MPRASASRGDEATTPSETVAARACGIDEVVNDEDLRLSGVGVARSPLMKSRLRYQVEFTAAMAVNQ